MVLAVGGSWQRSHFYPTSIMMVCASVDVTILDFIPSLLVFLGWIVLICGVSLIIV